MKMEELKDDLKKCKITFDKTVLVTDLINEYQAPLAKINEVLEDYVKDEETKGTKFEKRFLVSGEHKQTKKIIFGIVNDEQKLKDWLSKLEEANATLYSLKLSGGAKADTNTLKPVQYCHIKLDKIEERPPITYATVENGSAPEVQTEKKPDTKKGSIMNAFAKKAAETTPTVAAPATKKTSPETKKTTPEEKKPNVKGASSSAKKGINSFFAPMTPNAKAAAAAEKKDKPASSVMKPPSPKKMEHFFKKQTEVKKESSPGPANTSVQLFNEDAESEEESSDEEEKLEALKRDIISSDHEMETEEQDNKNDSSIAMKRRRIVDSDDEEEEPQKKKKEDEKPQETVEIEEDDTPASESFLDEDGFVITIKNKKKAPVKKPTKSPPPPKVLRKSPMKPAPAAATTTKGKAQASKTKQGNIMSFFTKK